MNFTSRASHWMLLTLVLAIGGGAFYASKHRDKAPQQAEVIVKVFQANEVTRPQLKALSGQVDMSGVLIATELATVRSKVAGALMRLNVAEGQLVQKGQVLAELDVRDLISRTDERQAAVVAAQRNHQLSLVQHKANEDLARQSFISETALAASQANLASQLAQLKAAESAKLSHTKQLADAAITAPFDGVVARRMVTLGEKLSIDQEVFHLVNPRRLEFKTMVDSAAGQFLKPGLQVQIQFEAVATPVQGRIDRIGPGNDLGTRALPVYVSLAEPVTTSSIRPGLMGLAHHVYALDQEGLTLPVAAVQEEGGKSIVWVIHDGILKRQTVSLGLKDAAGSHVYILDGIKASDTVLALRFEGLKEGLRVEVKP